MAGSRPPNGAKVASLGGPITIEFSEAVQTASFSYDVWPLLGDVSLDWSADRRTVSIRHAESGRGTLYTITVLAVEDDAGLSLSGPYQWSFTTATYGVCLPAVLHGS